MLTLEAPVAFVKHYMLKHAQMTIAEGDHQSRIWAADRVKKDGSIGKFFVVGKLSQFLEHMRRDEARQFSWYEVISKDYPCRFHVDVEIGLVAQPDPDDDRVSAAWMLKRLELFFGCDDRGDGNGNGDSNGYGDMGEEFARYMAVAGAEWDEADCVAVGGFITTAFDLFVKHSFGRLRVVWLTSCRAKKFSLHGIVPGLVFERGYISCRYLAWEFARYLWKQVNSAYEAALRARRDRGVPVPRKLYRLLMLDRQYDRLEWKGLNDTPVDESIYTNNRQFRLVGNCKAGSVPLVVLDAAGPKYLVTATPREVLTQLSLPAFARTLVSVRGEVGGRSLKMTDEFPFLLQCSRRFNDIFGNSTQIKELEPLRDPHEELLRTTVRFRREKERGSRAARHSNVS